MSIALTYVRDVKRVLVSGVGLGRRKMRENKNQEEVDTVSDSKVVMADARDRATRECSVRGRARSIVLGDTDSAM